MSPRWRRDITKITSSNIFMALRHITRPTISRWSCTKVQPEHQCRISAVYMEKLGQVSEIVIFFSFSFGMLTTRGGQQWTIGDTVLCIHGIAIIDHVIIVQKCDEDGCWWMVSWPCVPISRSSTLNVSVRITSSVIHVNLTPIHWPVQFGYLALHSGSLRHTSHPHHVNEWTMKWRATDEIYHCLSESRETGIYPITVLQYPENEHTSADRWRWRLGCTHGLSGSAEWDILA